MASMRPIRSRVWSRQPTLPLLGSSEPTRRGQVLILGGDEVYPTASFDEYRIRTLLPYRAAMSSVKPAESVPDVFAIPGNHDRYDGLTAFERIFCQERWFAAWKTHQRRSYFALKLPQRWWLWGLDTQLDGNLDQPQLEYFEQVAREHMAEGDRMILCSPQPGWVEAHMDDPRAFRAQAFFEQHVVRDTAKAQVKLALSGDLHHYLRYESADGNTQRVTAGGGGAYLYPTHQMPQSIVVPADEEVKAAPQPQELYQAKAAFPSRQASSRMAWKCLLLPVKSWHFTLFLATLYALYGWFLQCASKMLFVPSAGLPAGQPSSLMERLQALPPSVREIPRVGAGVAALLAHSPSCVAFTLLILGGLIAFCSAPRTLVRCVVGGLHGLAHLAVAIGGLWMSSVLNLQWCAMSVDSPLQVLVFCLEMALLGSVAGGLVMAMISSLASSTLGRLPTPTKCFRASASRTTRTSCGCISRKPVT